MPRLAPGLLLLGVTASAMGWRVIAAKVLNSSLLRQRTVVLGPPDAVAKFVGNLLELAPQYEIIAVYTLDGSATEDGLTPAPRGRPQSRPLQGTAADFVDSSQELNVDVVLFSPRQLAPEGYNALLNLRQRGAILRTIRSVSEELFCRVPLGEIDEAWFATRMWGDGASLLYISTKRAIDVMAAVAGLLLTALVLPLVVLAVRLDDAGPVFYSQERLGLGGARFRILKFRTMTVSAEEDGTPLWTAAQDTRITRVGRLLRRTRLDELPQVWNVLKGEMSLVGPRPEQPAIAAELEGHIPEYRTRMIVKPGLTGWAQINSAYANSIEDMRIKLQFDLYYIKRRSLFLDLLIMIRTWGAIITFRPH
jgi:exopolysaccharide biosynthesis polyprenyl glycosylphosphotransferase